MGALCISRSAGTPQLQNGAAGRGARGSEKRANGGGVAPGPQPFRVSCNNFDLPVGNVQR